MNNKSVIIAIVALLIGAAAGHQLSGTSQMPAQKQESGSSDGEREVLFWRNPMNPAITSPVFMKDEMGMDYLPVYADGGSSGANDAVGTVTIDPVTIQNIAVRTATVEKRPLARQLNALGHVDFNEERLARLHPKVSGWIQQLLIDETGAEVENDTILLEIYSPDLVAAQQEYLVALENWERMKNNTAKRILDSALERLELFDVPSHQIHELRKSRHVKKALHIHSPFAGRVMHIGVREGQYVTPKDEIYLIADLDRIWVYVDVYESDLPWVKVGDKAELTVRAAPGKMFKGKVVFIHPMQDRTTRTVRLRLEFNNPKLILKPGMFANVTLFVDEQPEAVVVPSEAIVRSGERDQLFVAKGGGTFEPRTVTLGLSSAGFTQVLHGVKPGEKVVTSSQFLIDSESKLLEATAKMLAPESHDQDMGDMDMSDMSMEDMDVSDLNMSDMTMDDLEMDHE